jgi:hypothetical protein
MNAQNKNNIDAIEESQNDRVERKAKIARRLSDLNKR